MTYIIGRGVKVEVGKTEAAAKVVSAVTQAKPAKATSAAHGLLAKTVGYFINVLGMAQLEGMALRVANPTPNDFELENLNATNYPIYAGGSFVPVTAWSTLSPATSYDAAGGEANKLDSTVLLDDIAQQQNGLMSAQTVTIGLNAETVYGEALQIITEAAMNSAYLVFRVTWKDGAVRIFRGQPSLPGESVQKGQLGTGQLSITVKGFIMQGA